MVFYVGREATASPSRTFPVTSPIKTAIDGHRQHLGKVKTMTLRSSVEWRS